MNPIFTVGVSSACLTFFMLPFIRRLAIKWKILDLPDERKIHKTAIPRLGGVAVFLSFLLVLVKVSFESKTLRGILLGGFLIVLIGLIDDIKPLGAKLKLGGQILAAGILISEGIILSFFPHTFLGKIGAGLLTLIWILGITNGMNFIDGMDGLAVGLSAISSLSFLFIAIMTNQFLLALTSAALLGACLGFLPYNFYPAKIFLGDAGSTFLGFVLASLAVMGGWAEDNPLVALGTPLVILGILIFDLIYITFSRVFLNKVHNFWQWLDYVGKDHLHHRLFNLGFSQPQTVFFIYLIGIYFGISGVVLSGLSTKGAILILIQALLIFIVITVLMNVGKRRVENS